MGGLGNQLFQYALGRNLAISHNTSLLLDISFYENTINRTFDINNFRISNQYCDSKEIILLRSDSKYLTIKSYIQNFFPNFSKTKLQHIKEHSFNFDPKILELPDNVYLEGYWQSEKYFKQIESTIRSEFELIDPEIGIPEQLKEEILNSNSVSVHFRRGDYVSNPSTYQTHGICSIQYYYKAIRMISDLINNPVFYVFSDDIDWVKTNFRCDSDLRYIQGDSSNSHIIDFSLMRLCKHHIIANSTFSWWAAWLGANSNKKIFAPKKWFNDIFHDTRDIYPDTWIKL